MSWIVDVNMHFESIGFTETIRRITSSQNKADAMNFLRRHLEEGLKCEYLTIKYPSILWKDPNERYEN